VADFFRCTEEPGDVIAGVDHRRSVHGNAHGERVLAHRAALVEAHYSDRHSLVGGWRKEPIAIGNRTRTGDNLTVVEIAIHISSTYRQNDLTRRALEECRVSGNLTDRR